MLEKGIAMASHVYQAQSQKFKVDLRNVTSNTLFVSAANA